MAEFCFYLPIWPLRVWALSMETQVRKYAVTIMHFAVTETERESKCVGVAFARPGTVCIYSYSFRERERDLG